MEQNINISQWEGLITLEKLQIETNAYRSLLEWLIGNQIDVENNYYQYYEDKFLNSYYQLDKQKRMLERYLEQTYNITSFSKWQIDFFEKTIKITLSEN